MANITNIASKAIAVMATGATLYEANYQGVRKANIKRQSEYADDFIANQIGASKANYPSATHSALKSWLVDFKFPYKFSEFTDTITGYVEGALKGLVRNFSTLGFSALAFFGKGKAQKIGLIGTGLSVAWDILKNTTNVFERTDYLRK